MEQKIKEIIDSLPDISGLTQERNLERKRYIKCFIDYVDGCDGNWGEKAGGYEILRDLNLNSICDVGCGVGNFIHGAVSKGIVSYAYGIDPASIAINKLVKDGIVSNLPGAIANGNLKIHDCITYHEGDACYIPLPDKCVDAVTSFDAFEHILINDIDDAINECKRVSTRYVLLTIGLGSSKVYEGKNNHPLDREPSWWISKLSANFSNVKVLPYTRSNRTLTVLCMI